MSAYKSLETKLGFTSPLLVDEQWAAAADFLHSISDYCLLEKPQVIVECSSGISSLVLARCCQINQQGHVFSLENGDEFVKQTQQQLDRYQLSDYCDVIHAPLERVVLGEIDYQWYSASELLNKVSIASVGMLVIDGPPGFLQKNSRYPALPLLVDLLAKSSVVFLDDAARDDERDIVALWLKQFSEFQSEYVDNERGCSILKR